MQLLLNILVFNVWLPTGDKEENKRGGVTGHLNALEVTSARGEGLVTMAASLFVYTLRSEATISNQCMGPQYLKDKVLIVHPSNSTLCKLRNTYVPTNIREGDLGRLGGWEDGKCIAATML